MDDKHIQLIIYTFSCCHKGDNKPEAQIPVVESSFTTCAQIPESALPCLKTEYYFCPASPASRLVRLRDNDSQSDQNTFCVSVAHGPVFNQFNLKRKKSEFLSHFPICFLPSGFLTSITRLPYLLIFLPMVSFPRR